MLRLEIFQGDIFSFRREKTLERKDLEGRSFG